MNAFQVVTGETVTIDQTYVDGLSITRGSPRQHLWALAVGLSKNYDSGQACPRDHDPFNFDNVPDFVGDHFYCESGFATSTSGKTATQKDG